MCLKWGVRRRKSVFEMGGEEKKEWGGGEGMERRKKGGIKYGMECN